MVSISLRALACAAFTLLLAVVTSPRLAEAHGGGCRKSSPPGQCCHMETATGRVHCH